MKNVRAFVLMLAILACGLYVGRFTEQPRVEAQGNNPGQFTYISTTTTTTVKATAGYLVAVTINGGTPGVVTLFDVAGASCTGTPGSGKFATIETIGTTNPVTLSYNLRTLNGICVVTAANTDLTVTFN